MKRLMPASLITFLQSNPNCLKADLFAINLPNGQYLSVCDSQFDIYIPSSTPGWGGAAAQTFRANKYGVWNRGAITSEASFECKANTMTLTCVPQPANIYKGTTIGLLTAAMNGLFDAATVTVYTAYMLLNGYGNVSAGLETKFAGTITKINDINRSHVEFECADAMYLLNMKVPYRLFQADCPWGFCDNNCTLSAANYTVSFTAASGCTSQLLHPSAAFTQAAGYFTQGVVTCTSGANQGLSQTVQLHDTSGNLELSAPYLMPIASGDTFSVIKGCNKTLSACVTNKTANGTVISNLINFGGTPYTPPPSTAV